MHATPPSRRGTCTECGRRVQRLWSGRRCARCAKTSWTVGSCSDCLAWATSIAAGRCRACREFTRRGRTGRCRSCRRELPINRHGRCRLCTATRRDAHLAGEYDAHLAGEYDGDLEPGKRAGIQLFLGDMHGGQRRPSPASGDQTGPPMGGNDHDRRDHDGGTTTGGTTTGSWSCSRHRGESATSTLCSRTGRAQRTGPPCSPIWPGSPRPVAGRRRPPALSGTAWPAPRSPNLPSTSTRRRSSGCAAITWRSGDCRSSSPPTASNHSRPVRPRPRGGPAGSAPACPA